MWCLLELSVKSLPAATETYEPYSGRLLILLLGKMGAIIRKLPR
jgi:hypothetical protein